MVDRFARLGILAAMGTDQVDPNGPRKAEVERARCFVFAPGFAPELFDGLFQLERIALDGDFDVANGMAAGKVADGVPGKKKEDPSLAGHFAQLPQGISLIG